MFPLYDSHPRRNTPLINYLLILANIGVFFIMLGAPDVERFIFTYGFIPAHFNLFNLHSYIPLFYSFFLHGGIFHILSNMWFLHIFGDNVEDEFGHFWYLPFYLAGGVAGALAQYLYAPSSAVPMIGASGAVSAVAGAYYVWFRQSRVRTLVALFVIWTTIDLPASIVLGYWFLTQLFASVGSLASYDPNQGGIAFFAHIGGFVFGYFAARLFPRRYGEFEALE